MCAQRYFFFAILLLIWISLVCFLIFRVRPSGGYYATGASSSSSSSRETKKRRCVGNSHRYTYASQSRMNKKKTSISISIFSKQRSKKIKKTLSLCILIGGGNCMSRRREAERYLRYPDGPVATIEDPESHRNSIFFLLFSPSVSHGSWHSTNGRIT